MESTEEKCELFVEFRGYNDSDWKIWADCLCIHQVLKSILNVVLCGKKEFVCRLNYINICFFSNKSL